MLRFAVGHFVVGRQLALPVGIVRKVGRVGRVGRVRRVGRVAGKLIISTDKKTDSRMF